MTIMELPSLIRSLTLIDDRRNNKNKRYPLPLLLLIAFCASIKTSAKPWIQKFKLSYTFGYLYDMKQKPSLPSFADVFLGQRKVKQSFFSQIDKIRELEKQAGKLRVKSTLYSLFGNTELDKAEKRIGELEREMEHQKFLAEKEKADIRKEVILLQDTIADKDKTIAGQQKEIKVYEEERSFIWRFFHSFFLLLNIRLLLRKMGVDDDTFVRMHQKQVAVRSTADVYSGMYKRNFTEENAEFRITTNEKRQPVLTINGLSVPDWCEQKWQQLIHRNRSQRL